MLAAEIGPQHIGENEFAVGRLPHEVIGEPILPRGANQQFGVGHIGGIQPLRDGALIDLFGRDALGHDGPHGVNQLSPTAVVEGNGESERAVALGEFNRLVDATQETLGNPPVTTADEANANTLGMQFVAAAQKQRFVKSHEETNLVDWPTPVLGGEGVDGEPLRAEVEGPIDGVHKRLFARGMTVGALEATSLCPSAIAIHDRSDMHRNAGWVNAGDVHRVRLPPPSDTTGTIGGPMASSDRLVANATRALETITAALPTGEPRIGQIDMAQAVARSISDGRHLVVEAGTGTGKTFAYLVPAIISGRRTVVATATKTLQDQLAKKDLPFLVEHLDRPITFAVLKGRSNYVCLQRIHELDDDADQLELDVGPRPPAEEIAAIARWAVTSETGDRAELTIEPSHRAWAAVSVGPRECPGATRCPKGNECFAEQARNAAMDADVIIVNTHLYGMHIATGGALLPEHDIVVIDEAHQLEDTIAATAGVDLTGGRFTALARTIAAIIADPSIVANIDELGAQWRAAIADERGRRLRGAIDGDAARVLELARARLEPAMAALRAIPDDSTGEVGARKLRAIKAATSLLDDIDRVSQVRTGEVSWIEGTEENPVLRVAPIDVGELLADTMWPHSVAILTSATLPAALPEQIGLEPDSFERLTVESPFDYPTQSLLYCAAHMPDPRSEAFDPAVHDELAALIGAAGGRTMALFTSHRALSAAVEALRDRIEVPILAQDDLPRQLLIERFTDEPETCLFATMGFWQGVDIPGATLSLVTIDRLPFPRPDDPLLQARRERARADAFRLVDLPRATTLLAQGAGRLIRTTTDRGVIAVFDPRMATNARYRWDVINALPPMPRTKERSEVEQFLRSLRDDTQAG